MIPTIRPHLVFSETSWFPRAVVLDAGAHAPHPPTASADKLSTKEGYDLIYKKGVKSP